jgi:hypothetical protein
MPEPTKPATDIKPTPTLTKAEEKDLSFFAKQAHVPVAEAKKVPEAPKEKSQQEQFNEKLRELSKKVLEVLNGAGSDQAMVVESVVHDTIKFAHSNNYRACDIPFDPLPTVPLPEAPKV